MNRCLAAIACMLLGFVLLPACGCSATPPEDHKALQRTIQEPIDRARAVEDTLQKQQDSMQRTLDESDG